MITQRQRQIGLFIQRQAWWWLLVNLGLEVGLVIGGNVPWYVGIIMGASTFSSFLWWRWPPVRP